MPRIRSDKVKERRLRVIGFLAEGRSSEEIAKNLGVTARQINDDIASIKKQSETFINDAIKTNTPYVLALSLHNVHEVIKKANEIYGECGEDRRLKLLTLKTVIDATRLQNETILGGFNHMSVTEANKMLELANNLGGASDQDNSKQVKSYMPALPTSEPNPNQNIPIIAKNESEIDSSELNPHVQTNYYHKKEKQEKEQEKVNKAM